MKVLLDQGVSPRLRRPLQEALDGASVESAMFRGWSALTDAELQARARNNGFTVLLTTDKRLAREQAPLSIAVIVLDDNRWSALLPASRQDRCGNRGNRGRPAPGSRRSRIIAPSAALCGRGGVAPLACHDRQFAEGLIFTSAVNRRSPPGHPTRLPPPKAPTLTCRRRRATDRLRPAPTTRVWSSVLPPACRYAARFRTRTGSHRR